MAGKSALIIGATGATGQHLLRYLLSSPEYTRVAEFGRRLTSTSDSKLEQHTLDFEKLSADDQGLKAGRWDVVFLTLGTTRAAAGSAEAFEKIDREYVLAAARAAKSDDPSHVQRLLYCSAQAANPNSSFLYPKSKGLTEVGLAQVGYADTIIFRPGFLAGRPGGRPSEMVVAPIMKAFSFIGPLSTKIQIDVSELARAMGKAGAVGSADLPAGTGHAQEGPTDARFTVVSNQAALKLANST